MNLVSLVIEGDDQSLSFIKNKLNIDIDASWQKGTQTITGKIIEKSGFTACIADSLTPSDMIEKLVIFLHHLDEKHIKFDQLKLDARLSIGFTVDDESQYFSTVLFPKKILLLVSNLGLDLSVSAYPATNE